MIFTDASLTRLAVHYTGNKQNGQALLLSGQEQQLDSEDREKLTAAFLTRFKDCHERYTFHHPSSLKYNEIYNFVKNIFADPATLFAQSGPIATHLHEVALHPKIKPGELYVTHFTNIIDDDQSLDAVGLFKAETKSLFADIDPSADNIDLHLKE